MPTTFDKVTRELTDGLVPALLELADLDREREKLPASYYEKERATVIRRARIADDNARAALAAYRTEELADARADRARAEADRDPAERLADEMEMQRLAASSVDASEFVRRAEEMLDAGQPKRAAMLVEVARAKRARYVDDLARRVDEALDEAIPARRIARDTERTVARNTAEFEASRLALVTKYGVGLDRSGALGTGAPAQAAASSVRAKLAAQETARLAGRPYKEPAGTLASAPRDRDE